MTFVEHKKARDYPPLAWGKDISVRVCADELEVSGVVPIVRQDWDASPDALRAYRQAMSRFGGSKRQGKNSPHIQFANANDDEQLIRFVQQFGPVVACSMRTEEREVLLEDSYDFRSAIPVLVGCQNMAELRMERAAYRAALALVSELQKGRRSNMAAVRGCIPQIVENASLWPQQWERERQLRASGQGYGAEPKWFFRQPNLESLQLSSFYATREKSGDPLINAFTGPDPIAAGHNIICDLVNAFSPLVYAWGHAPVEAPDFDLTCGIRPLLYFMLRRQYLERGGISICRNIECRNVFEIERSGQEFCGDLCSRLQRQREYWQKVGKKRRRRRARFRKTAR